MPEVSAAMLISCGLIGPKVRPPLGGVADGQQVKIPVFVCIETRPPQGGAKTLRGDKVGKIESCSNVGSK